MSSNLPLYLNSYGLQHRVPDDRFGSRPAPVAIAIAISLAFAIVLQLSHGKNTIVSCDNYFFRLRQL